MKYKALYQTIINDVAKIVKRHILESAETQENKDQEILFDRFLRFKEAIDGQEATVLQLASDLREILIQDPNISFKDILQKYNMEDKYSTFDISVMKDCYDYIADEEHMFHVNLDIEKLLFLNIIGLYEKHKMFYARLNLQSPYGKLYPFKIFAYNIDDLLIKCKILYILGSVKFPEELELAINRIDEDIEIDDFYT